MVRHGQGCAVDLAPTDLQKKVQQTSADQTSMPSVPVTASPGLKPKGKVCEERALRYSQAGQAWIELQRRQGWGPTHETTHQCYW